MNFQANSALLPEEDRVGGHRCGLDNSTVLARQIEAHLTATMQSSADDFGEQTDYALPKVMERDEVDLQRFAEFITGDDSWRTDNIEFAQPQQFDVFNDILLNTPAHGGSPTVAPQAYEPTRTTGVDTSGFAHSFTETKSFYSDTRASFVFTSFPLPSSAQADPVATLLSPGHVMTSPPAQPADTGRSVQPPVPTVLSTAPKASNKLRLVPTPRGLRTARTTSTGTSLRSVVAKKEWERKCDILVKIRMQKSAEDTTSIVDVLQKRLHVEGALPPELFEMILGYIVINLCGDQSVEIKTLNSLEDIYYRVKAAVGGSIEDIKSRLISRIMGDNRIQLAMHFASPTPDMRIPLPPYHLGLVGPVQWIQDLDFTLTVYRSGQVSYPSQLYIAQDSLPHLKTYFPSLKNVRMTVDDTMPTSGTVLARDKKSALTVRAYRTYVVTLIAHLARLEVKVKRARVLHPKDNSARDSFGWALLKADRWGEKARIWRMICGAREEDQDQEGFYKVTEVDAVEFEQEMEKKMGIHRDASG